jgi:hypothetical protein
MLTGLRETEWLVLDWSENPGEDRPQAPTL